MKANKSGGGIKGLFLAHGEKLGMLVVAGAAGWLLYASLGQEAEDRVPADLSNTVSQAKQNVERFNWTNALEEQEGARLAETFVPLASVAVDTGHYTGAGGGWDESPVPPTVLRNDPPLFPAVGLTGSGGTELMGFAGSREDLEAKRLEDFREERMKERERQRERERQAREDEDGRRESRADDLEDQNRRQIVRSQRRGGVSLDESDRRQVVSYATVLAKVPVEEQLDAYRNTLENALGFDYGNDQPVYLGYFVERREVRGDQRGVWQRVRLRNGYSRDELEAVDRTNLLKSTADWPEDLEEPADAEYLHPVLTFPLPPLVGRSWGSEVVHPDVPLQVESDMAEQEEEEDPLDLAEGEGGLFSGGGDGGASRGRRFGGGSDEGGRRGGAKRFFEGEGEFGGGRRGRRGQGDGQLVYTKPFLMLRFFDMRVKPGRQYQYRVRLVLRDANDGVRKTYLAKEVNERRAAEEAEKKGSSSIRLTDWSDPTPPIPIPLAGAVSVASVKPAAANSFNAEDSVNAWVASYDVQEGELVEASVERSFRRGAVANFVAQDVEYVLDRYLVRTEEFRFRTDVMVLDIRGGEKLGRDGKTPAEVLVMDGSGGLTVRNQLADRRKVEEIQELYAEDERGRGRQRDGGSRSEFGFGFGEE